MCASVWLANYESTFNLKEEEKQMREIIITTTTTALADSTSIESVTITIFLVGVTVIAAFFFTLRLSVFVCVSARIQLKWVKEALTFASFDKL